MNGPELKQALLRELWVEAPDRAPAYVHADAAISVNQAAQEIWSAPKADHFTRSHFEFSTVATTPGYVLNPLVLRIIGPVQADGQTVRPVNSRGTFDQFASRFDSAGDPLGRPKRYYLDSTWQNAEEAMMVQMLLSPTPDKVYTMTFEARLEAPRVTACDLESSETVIPMPNRDVESLLLPIARYHLARSHWFSNETLYPRLEADYQRAMVRLGLTAPESRSHLTKPGKEAAA